MDERQKKLVAELRGIWKDEAKDRHTAEWCLWAAQEIEKLVKERDEVAVRLSNTEATLKEVREDIRIHLSIWAE